MELRRKRYLVLGPVPLAIGLALLLYAVWLGWPWAIALFVLGAIAALWGASISSDTLRPFRVHIGPDGLRLRLRGINRLVSWDEIAAVVIDWRTPDISKTAAPCASSPPADPRSPNFPGNLRYRPSLMGEVPGEL